jgi:poly(3-hydroxybutyrate) depolymerase
MMKIVSAALCVLGLASSAEAQTRQSTTLSGSRSFHYVVPSACRGNNQCPLLLSWHGYGGNGNTWSNTNNWRDVNARNWIGAWPTGTGIGTESGHNGGGCCGSSRRDDVQFARDIVSFLEQNETASVDYNHVFATGYSNGGFMSHRLACEASDLFTAIAPYAGYKSYGNTFTNCNNQVRPVAVHHYHGTADTVIRYTGYGSGNSFASFRSNFDDYSNQYRCAGPAIETVRAGTTCDIFNSCDATVRFCTIQNQSHSYPNWLWSEILGTFDGIVGNKIGTSVHSAVEANEEAQI